MIQVRFMSLVGKFSAVKTESFETMSAAQAAVEAYAQAAGFRNVRLVDGPDFDDIRFTATSPGGRGWRNVAFACDDDPGY
jgi:hypothetical protein